ncbi:MAG: sulfotransferase [Candidatus Nitricoxidivorans perseverans]|uniref:Sulfotransferase n=1 Tax=Candidatus Nitricoxidivorans perseverans TaxID=2975601 RepID=A0AA49FLV3_9PROT|nr:MAG: sulfotransferase [Candidatus Nitricoxidivorans perseverans]
MHSINPVFLLGPGRSGTTLLYKILSLHPEVGFISNYDERFSNHLPTPLLSRLLAPRLQLKQWSWFNDHGNAYFKSRPWLRKLIPTPVEGERIFSRSGMTLAECDTAASATITEKLRRNLIWLQRHQGSKALLIKRTANNRRIPCLAAAFPEARYLFLLRDGRSVADSLTKVRWWNDHQVWWANHQTPLQLQNKSQSMLGIAARNWTEEMRCIQFGLRGIKPENVLMVRYEELLDRPLECLHVILQFIGVKPCAEHDAAIAARRLANRRESWRDWTADQLDLVMSIQREYLKIYGYV